MQRILPLLVLLVLLPVRVEAAVFSSAGYSFSDELGGFRLLSVSGSGTFADPIVIVEEYLGPGPAVLTVRGGLGSGNQPGAYLPAMSMLNLSVVKIVVNLSQINWTSFDIELREVVSDPSPYGDGLSFDQAGTYGSAPEADRFAKMQSLYEPADHLQFYSGRVFVTETARLRFYITDPSPTGLFYLVQQPGMIVARN